MKAKLKQPITAASIPKVIPKPLPASSIPSLLPLNSIVVIY
jgi:hypothetical protein